MRIPCLVSGVVVWGVVMGAMAPGAWAAWTVEDVFPEEEDAFVGDYVGRWTRGEVVDPAVAAQVIALGRDRYRIRVVSKLDMRCPVMVSVEVKAEGGRLAFEEGRYAGEISDGRFSGSRGGDKAAFEMKRVVRLSPTLGAAPPEGAVVLFDGSGMDAWQESKGWEVLDDEILMVTPQAKSLFSKGRFLDLRLHVEFREPFLPRSRGQNRGNSGVFLQGVYEVQVLDSYGLEGLYNECGALYKLAAPRVNACAPPLQWQTYDITYRAPRYEGGQKVANGRMTVVHNGVPIHDDQELKWITAFTEMERTAPAPNVPGPLQLSAHANFVQYRNIWLVELGD